MASAIFSPFGLSSIAFSRIASLTESRYPLFSKQVSILSGIAAWVAAMQSVFKLIGIMFSSYRRAAPDSQAFMLVAHTANSLPENFAEKLAKMNDVLIYVNTQDKWPIVLRALSILLSTCFLLMMIMVIGQSRGR
ncbi:hypothetical protein B0T11DRAFT_297878 [Plectosphaerella cucumerina]|uniref:Uncharacterized protein n=1 Tax=Plectosphaerella cucumerina TaxID=40658 RepID=A0A8K0TH95_9PEZI|nr:hypothetical protein B0T11DRAFT_297878 [Plectosphaerella cucumerina]